MRRLGFRGVVRGLLEKKSPSWKRKHEPVFILFYFYSYLRIFKEARSQNGIYIGSFPSFSSFTQRVMPPTYSQNIQIFHAIIYHHIDLIRTCAEYLIYNMCIKSITISKHEGNPDSNIFPPTQPRVILCPVFSSTFFFQILNALLYFFLTRL